ncbi:uncharacterized protein G2W53_017358 [Senna tora]|uniref:Uncharacterized protein n=1 Tax=Senna tora TaxID=362788 RepID=A0A834TR22_9FABA|nr:uncharacterized protein G2W53_017358 [Senna tora]
MVPVRITCRSRDVHGAINDPERGKRSDGDTWRIEEHNRRHVGSV